MQKVRWREKSMLNVWVAGAVAGAMALSFAPTAKATPVTFAQFQETESDPSNPFAYFDNGTGSVTQDTSNDAQLITFNGSSDAVVSIPINFSYVSVPGLPADLQGDQAAMLSLSSSTVSTVQIFGSLSQQQITGLGEIPDILTVTRDTPAAEGTGSRTNLLTMIFTGAIEGTLTGRTPQLSGGTTLGNTVNYSSDFLSNLSSSSQNDFSLTFSSWTTFANSLGLQIDANDNYYDTAYAAGAATFDAQANVPEPGTFGLGAFGMLALLARRRKKARSAK